MGVGVLVTPMDDSHGYTVRARPGAPVTAVPEAMKDQMQSQTPAQQPAWPEWLALLDAARAAEIPVGAVCGRGPGDGFRPR